MCISHFTFLYVHLLLDLSFSTDVDHLSSLTLLLPLSPPNLIYQLLDNKLEQNVLVSSGTPNEDYDEIERRGRISVNMTSRTKRKSTLDFVHSTEKSSVYFLKG